MTNEPVFRDEGEKRNSVNPRSVRRRLLLALYARYLRDPLEMLTPEELISESQISRTDLVANIHYLHDRGFVELMMGYNPPLFAAARITADGIDIVENHFEFNLRFPPDGLSEDDSLGTLPYLCERLVEEADFSPLDGEERKTLLREVQFLRDELARPPLRWRRDVLDVVLGWIESHFSRVEGGVAEHLPSLARLRARINTHRED